MRHRIEYYPLYRAGHLLVKGGVSDQPARYLAYMRRIDELRVQSEAKYLELMKPEE